MSDKVIHYCRHCGDTLGGDNPCDCPAASIDAVLAGQACEIAALTEKLRAVEAERDEAHATIRARSAAHSQVADENGRLGAQLSALRAELERKDAALRVIAESDEWSGGLSNTSHQERARAALQPKEPPCQTA